MVTKNSEGESEGRDTAEPKKRGRGRPPGRGAQGEATQKALFDSAARMMNERGFEDTTLRDIAADAGVSHAVLYRYFPSKRAVVMALYSSLSERFAAETALPSGPWRTRSFAAIEGSLAALASHREALRSAIGVLVSATDEGLFAPSTRDSRLRVQGVFLEAVEGAKDAPRGPRAAALARTLDLAHLGIVLFWLLDASPKQRATGVLLGVVKKALPLTQAVLKLPGAWALLTKTDSAAQDGLMPASSSRFRS